MIKNIIKRIGQTVLILFGVALLIFIMLRIIPGNAVVTMMGEHANAEPHGGRAGSERAILYAVYPLHCRSIFR